MPLANNRADVLARARAALHDEGFAGEIHATGEGEVRGVPVRWSRTCHAGGSLLDNVDGDLSHAMGFDGVAGWCVDASGMPRVLELGDLDELVAVTAVWSGRWIRDGAVAIGDVVAATAGEIVLALRAGAREFRLALDARSYLPRRLVPAGRDDAALELADFRPGGFGMLPHVATSREAWLADTLHVATVERREAASAYGLAHDRPADVAWTTAATVWRTTRGGLFVVRPLVDGRDAGWFAIDTGASTLAIDERVAATLGLRERGRRMVRTSDGVAGAPYRWASSVAVGPLTLAAPRFIEVDLTPFGKGIGVPLAGVLGFDLFARAAISLDSVEGVGIAPAADDAADWLPLRFEDGVPVVAVRYPGGEGLVVLDTGSSAGLTIYAGAAGDVVLRKGGRVALRGLTGAVGARSGVLAWLELGGHRIEEVDAILARPGAGATGDPTRGHVLGNLGMGVVGDFAITVDYPRRRLRLARRSRAARRARPR